MSWDFFETIDIYDLHQPEEPITVNAEKNNLTSYDMTEFVRNAIPPYSLQKKTDQIINVEPTPKEIAEQVKKILVEHENISKNIVCSNIARIFHWAMDYHDAARFRKEELESWAKTVIINSKYQTEEQIKEKDNPPVYLYLTAAELQCTQITSAQPIVITPARQNYFAHVSAIHKVKRFFALVLRIKTGEDVMEAAEAVHIFDKQNKQKIQETMDDIFVRFQNYL